MRLLPPRRVGAAWPEHPFVALTSGWDATTDTGVLVAQSFGLDGISDEVRLRAGKSGTVSELDAARFSKVLKDRIGIAVDPIVMGDVLEAAGVRLPAVLLGIDQVVEACDPTARPGRGESIAGDAEPAELVSAARRALAPLTRFQRTTLERLANWTAEAGWEAAPLFSALLADLDRRPGGLAGQGSVGIEMRFQAHQSLPDPLEETGNQDPLAEERVVAVLGPNGTLSSLMPDYEKRDAQLAMALAVTRTLNGDGQAMLEAGTGTGKSLAYLVPGALYAHQRGLPIVISTHTHALQDQVIEHDLPVLRRALGELPDAPQLSVRTLKGRSNYLCLRRWQAHGREPLADPTDASFRAKATIWLADTTNGDRAELRMSGAEEGAFRSVAADTDACDPPTCPFNQRNQCFLFRARREAERSHVIVVNHALLLADAVEGGVLPQYGHLVIDEAHHLEAQATSQLGFRIRESELGEMIDALVKLDGPSLGGLAADAARVLMQGADPDEGERALARNREMLGRALAARTAAAELFHRLRNACQLGEAGFGANEQTSRVTPATRKQEPWESAEIAWEAVDRHVVDLERDASWLLGQVERVPETSPMAEIAGDLALELGGWVRRAGEWRNSLRSFTVDPEPNTVYWASLAARGGSMALASAPLRVGELLQGYLYEPLDALVLTSATLSSGDRFDYARRSLGLQDADAVTYPSPFDFSRAALVYVAEDMPDPTQEGHAEALADTIMETALALGGKTLVLFTSYAALNRADAMIREPLAKAGISVLAQRTDGSAQQLVDRLRSTDGVVVLGAASMWEGIDVPGEQLSALIVTRMPFSVPTDPVFEARSEEFERPFDDYAVPQAILRFRQGFGRLIRRRTDRGICIVLDRRIITKSYGRAFTRSLPDCVVEVGLARDAGRRAASWVNRAGAE